METNQDIINTGVNGTSVDNRGASSGSQVCGEMEGQGPGGRHQATDHIGREEDAAEMRLTETRSKKKWMKDENKEIWLCYRMSNPAMRGYRKRMHNIWHERYNAPQTTKAGRPNLWHHEEQLALCDRKRRDRKTTNP